MKSSIFRRSSLRTLAASASVLAGLCLASPDALASRSDIYTPDHVQSIQAGMNSEDVLSRIGKPTKTSVSIIGGKKRETWHYDKGKTGIRGTMTSARALLSSAARLAPDHLPELAEADKRIGQAQKQADAVDSLGRSGGLTQIVIKLEDNVVTSVDAI